ncbi:hypothetical protein [Klebsiella pneumoniae]
MTAHSSSAAHTLAILDRLFPPPRSKAGDGHLHFLKAGYTLTK